MNTVDDFEMIVFSQQQAVTPWHPVTPFDFASRKHVEGDHPRLILETFHPVRILDVGCGPGHLIRLLNEQHGSTIAFGGDMRSDADYWLDITEKPADIGGDLVICREVLEHLTLLQIRKAIRHLCTLSSLYVYVTTRLSSEHDVFRVEQHDALDPTHITIPSKDLLRLLFTLEGFKRRADLERQIDWKMLNRCLVYERAVS